MLYSSLSFGTCLALRRFKPRDRVTPGLVALHRLPVFAAAEQRDAERTRAGIDQSPSVGTAGRPV